MCKFKESRCNTPGFPAPKYHSPSQLPRSCTFELTTPDAVSSLLSAEQRDQAVTGPWCASRQRMSFCSSHFPRYTNTNLNLFLFTQSQIIMQLIGTWVPLRFFQLLSTEKWVPELPQGTERNMESNQPSPPGTIRWRCMASGKAKSPVSDSRFIEKGRTAKIIHP